MSVNFNPYENYRIRVFENSGELRNYKKDVVVDNRRERVVLLIGQVAPDKFAIGYLLRRWAASRTAPVVGVRVFRQGTRGEALFLGVYQAKPFEVLALYYRGGRRFDPHDHSARAVLIRKRANDYIQSGQGRREVFRRVGVSLHRPVLCFYAGLFFPHTPFVENVWESAAVQGIR